MLEFLNNSIVIASLFPLLCVLGIHPLLRWAIGGEKQDTFASLNLSLGVLIGIIAAYGRPEELYQFGSAALFYAMVFLTGCGLLTALFLRAGFLQKLIVSLLILVWGWVLLGMPLELDMLFKALFAGYILLALAFLWGIRNLIDHEDEERKFTSMIIMVLLSANLMAIAYLSGENQAFLFALSLIVIALGGQIWLIPKFNFNYSMNGMLVLVLANAALGWELWLKGHLPIISLMCLSLILFAKSALTTFVQNRSGFWQKSYYVLLILFCLLPSGLSLLFFDVMRNLQG